MAVFVNGMFSGWGTAGASSAAVRTSAEELRLWTAGSFILFGDEALNFGHINERVAQPANLQKDFSASAFGMLGFEGRNLGNGAGSRYAFVTGTTEIAAIRFVGSNVSITLAGSQIATYVLLGYSDATYYTVEFAFGTSGGNVVCETRIDGVRVAALTTSGFTASGGQDAGTMSAAIAAAGTPITGVIFHHGNTGQPLLYYVWLKNHSAVWTSIPTGGTAFVDQSDFVGVKKKYLLTPNALGNYTMPGAGSGTQLSTWTNGAGTLPANLADAAIDDTSYIQNTTDAGGSGSTLNAISVGYTNLPAAATRVGWVQRTAWARAFQAPSGVRARCGVRSGAGDSPANTDFYDTTAAQAPSFGEASYTPGVVAGGGTRTCSVYYAQQGTLAQFTTGGTTVWSVTTVNAIEGIFQTIDIL